MTVVICTYSVDRWDSLQRAVAAVVSQQPPADELIIVVDHSPEVEVLADEMSDARVIANRGPRGLSAARNTGISAATGDIVVFLDDDASPDPDWLQSLMAHFDKPLGDHDLDVHSSSASTTSCLLAKRRYAVPSPTPAWWAMSLSVTMFGWRHRC